MSDTQPTQPLPPAQPHLPALQQPPVEPFYKRHGLAFAISTLVLAVILLFGAVGVGAFALSAVVFHSGSPLSRLLHEGDRGGQAPVLPRGPGNGGGVNGQGRNGGHGGSPMVTGVARGSITKIAGTTWTIRTQRGATLTVGITSSTVYGLPGQARKASDFQVGDDVIVIGTRSGDTVKASRILTLSDLPIRPEKLPGSSATPGPSATPGSSTPGS